MSMLTDMAVIKSGPFRSRSERQRCLALPNLDMVLISLMKLMAGPLKLHRSADGDHRWPVGADIIERGCGPMSASNHLESDLPGIFGAAPSRAAPSPVQVCRGAPIGLTCNCSF